MIYDRWPKSRPTFLLCLEVVALVVFLPVGELAVRAVAWRGLNLASAPLLYAASLHAETMHRTIAPAKSTA